MKKIASSIAFHFVGLPYTWGGDDAIAGIDCSGFVQIPLKSVGKLPRGYDATAEGIYLYFKNLDKVVQKAKEGCLVFWAKNNKINHVEYVWKYGLTIGASGGGSKTGVDRKFVDRMRKIFIGNGLILADAITISEILGVEQAKLTAIQHNAYVKIRPMRKDVFAIVDPFKKGM